MSDQAGSDQAGSDQEGSDQEGAVVRRLLADRHDLNAVEVARFSDDHPTFWAACDDGRTRVIRTGRGLDRYAAVLSALERAGCPAPRAIPDQSGSWVSTISGGSGVQDALVMTHVDGVTTPFQPEALGELGAALGRLHRRGAAAIKTAADPLPGLPVIERAGMLPANELAFGLSCLGAVDDLVEDEDRSEWQCLVDRCEEAKSFGTGSDAGLTEVFLHGDAHPWNSVQSLSGAVSLIDWDSSGPGPAVIDLGFLAVSCDTGGLIGPLAPPDPSRLDAVLAGYAREMTLTAADLDAFETAVTFRVLVCVAVGFGVMVREGRRPLNEPSIGWSLARLKAAPAIARRAHDCLEVRR